MNTLISSGLLAVGLVLGQSGDAPAGGAKAIVPPLPTLPPMAQAQTPSPSQSSSNRPIIGFFRGLFRKDAEPKKDSGKVVEPPKDNVIRDKKIESPNNDFPRKLPNPTSQNKTPAGNPIKESPASSGKEIHQATLQQSASPANSKSPILPQLANSIGRDEKFEWITGQYEIENGNHVLYYATPDTIDKFNGHIILVGQQSDFNQFRKGDLISVRGQLANRPTATGIIAIYRITSAAMIERPKAK